MLIARRKTYARRARCVSMVRKRHTRTPSSAGAGEREKK
jgi:hypothetical protein